ncbi:MAG: DinB family protein [Acidobacteriota bacterium]|nr:DinB family protein [Acidobacteriota bacterium]
MVHELVGSVERARTAVIDAVRNLRTDQGSFKPTPVEWSIAENVEHLYLAEISGLTKIWAAARQVRDGIAWEGDRPNHGKSIESVVATTWKPKEMAPGIATPHMGGPLEVWISSLRSLRSVLADLAKELGGLDLEAIVFPHFLSGPLDGRQRLEFLRFHMERHLEQIRRVQSHPAFPK